MPEMKKETATGVRMRCLEDARFRRWVETLRLRNANTADTYVTGVIRLTRSIGLDPLAYVALYDADDTEAFNDATQDIANVMVRAGRTYRRSRRLAAFLAKSSLRNWPEFARPHLTLGDVDLHRRRIKRARSHYEAALDLLQDPASRGVPMSGIVRCELRLGDPHAALEWLRRIERVNPEVAREVAADPAWSDHVPPLVRRLRSERRPSP